jgi:hypothetical protein
LSSFSCLLIEPDMAGMLNRLALPNNKQISDFERQESCASTCATLNDDAICAICFEAGPFISLPCDCTLNYCAGCWDRALAASVSARGRAQCPSCRGAFRVDYDPVKGSLVFSKEMQAATLADWRARLYEKVGPAQISLLQEYGRMHSAGSHCLAAMADSGTSSSALALAPIHPAVISTTQQSEPHCVCGGVLERIDRRTRVVRMLDDTTPGWKQRVPDPERLLQSLISSITCDLCNEISTRTGYGWTCKSGPHTVLHPAAYDICESCFEKHCNFHFQQQCGSPQLQILADTSKHLSTPKQLQTRARSPNSFLSSCARAILRRTDVPTSDLPHR